MNEVSISSARASVMVYDDVNKKWIPSGTSSGLSKVQLYHHLVNNTFRVVGRKLQDHEIVINCAILKGLKYNQATVTFHQWRDNKQVYGLNFSSKDDADAFARAMLQALDVLSNGSNISRSLGPAVTPATQQQPAYPQQPQQPPPQQQQQQQQQQTQQPQLQPQQPPQQQPPQINSQYDEDMGYSQGQAQIQDISTMGTISRVSLSLGRLTARGSAPSSVPPTPSPNHNHPSISNGTTTVIQVGCTPCTRGSPAEAPMRTMTREDVAIIQERRMSQQNQATNGPGAISPSCSPATQQQQSGHHRTSSAPPAPQPQPPPMQPGGTMVPAVPQLSIGGPPVPPPQPPAAPPAPPCPPSMMNFTTSVPPPMMTQYAQMPSQSSIPNQSQSQPIYGTNQGSSYVGNTVQTNQYTGNQNPSGNQYTAQNQNSIYGSNGQSSAYNQSVLVSQSNQSSQYASNPSSQYGGSQYGSSSSINLYASSSGQFVSTAQGQPQYGVVVQSSQGQYGNPQSGTSTNPYGTPSNSVNQYATGGPAANANAYNPINSSGPPPPPMGPPGGPAAPPPPPPPPAPNATTSNVIPSAPSMGPGMLNSSSDIPPDTNSLAAALQAARLKKKQQSQPVENSGSSTSSSGSGGGGGNYGTLGRGGGGGMASMMDEMAKTLARRRAAVEKKQPEQPPEPESSPDKKWDKSNSSNNKFSNGAESPKSARKRFGSASEDTLLKVNGVSDGSSFSAQEMEALKAEIIKEVRKEFQKLKLELVDALKGELRSG